MLEKEMTKIEKKIDHGSLSRRDFLRDAGLVVGGATLGSISLLNACSSKNSAVIDGTDTSNITKLADVTTTTTSPPITVTTTISKFICPLDNQDFTSLDALKAHFTTAHPAASLTGLTNLEVNGITYWQKLEPNWTLAKVLRETLGLTGTKVACDRGICGACTVLINNKPVLACMILAVECKSVPITTIEGISTQDALDPIQESFIKNNVIQCGYCTPGVILTAKGLLLRNPKPTEDDIKQALSGNLCRCGAYPRSVAAVKEVAGN